MSENALHLFTQRELIAHCRLFVFSVFNEFPEISTCNQQSPDPVEAKSPPRVIRLILVYVVKYVPSNLMVKSSTIKCGIMLEVLFTV